MSAVNRWALTVAVTTIVGGVVLAAIPPGKLKKSTGYAVALAVIACFFLPLAGGLDFELATDSEIQSAGDTQAFLSSVYEGVLSYAAYELAAELKDCAGAQGVEIESAEVSLSVDESKTVTVHKVTVTAQLDAADENAVIKLVHELFGEAAEIEFR